MVHGPYVEVIGEVKQLWMFKWSVSGNGGRLDLFKCRRSCEKFRKKVVKDVGMLCENKL